MEPVQNQMNSIEIVTALIGVGATILGTILGWVLNNLSSYGKLNIFTSSFRNEFKAFDGLGDFKQCSDRNSASCYNYSVSLDIYNSGGDPKIMRDIKIVLNDGKNDLLSNTPFDNATMTNTFPGRYYEKVEPLNIPPKAVITLDLHDTIDNKNDEFNFIWKTKKIFLTYTNEKNKSKKVLLKNVDYEHYFEKAVTEET